MRQPWRARSTSHRCCVLYTTLGERAVQEQDAELAEHLRRAAEQASQARQECLDAAREFRDITTDTRGHNSSSRDRSVRAGSKDRQARLRRS
jgi:hypothetical protein